MTRQTALLAAMILGLAAFVAAGCSGSDDPQSAEDVPSGAVAKVGDQEIGEDDLERQVAALGRAQRSSGAGKAKKDKAATRAQRDVLRNQALAMLVMREALEQEAAERGVKVADEEVSQRWEAAAGQQFKTKKALRRFLGGQSEQDILDQLRLQMLSEGIAEQISEEAGGGKKGQHAVRRFQKEFRERWAERTACAKGYDGPGCSAGAPD